MRVAQDGEDIHVALGTIVGEIKEVSRSYKEARWLWMWDVFSLMTEILLRTAPWELAV